MIAQIGAVNGMTFGERLRQARVAHGWSREQMVLVIRSRRKADNIALSADTIKAIELGETPSPRDTTRAILASVLPELAF